MDDRLSNAMAWLRGTGPWVSMLIVATIVVAGVCVGGLFWVPRDGELGWGILCASGVLLQLVALLGLGIRALIIAVRKRKMNPN